MTKKEASVLGRKVREDIKFNIDQMGKASMHDALLVFHRIIINTLTLLEYYNAR